MSLEELMASGLPLNRKERFYTGTVLPMIVCADNFSHFDRLTDLIPGYRAQALDWTPEATNVQLFTEYSFVESVFGPSKSRFPNPPTAKNTPDVMVLIRGARSVLIAIEAKMFDNPIGQRMRAQMEAQQEILEYLTRSLRLDEVHHVALLPEKLVKSLGPLGHPIITWEQIYESFVRDRSEDYFLGVLRIAIHAYDDLVSRGTSLYGLNSEGKLSGAELERLFRAGAAPALMGRTAGLNGPKLSEDIRTGRWKTQMYETRGAGDAPNRNWFSVSEFIERLATDR